MKKRIWQYLAVSAWLCAAVPAQTSADEVWEDISRGNLEISAVATQPGAIFMGAKGGVFVSHDAAGSWRNILSLRGDKGRVNLLVSDAQDKRSLYAASADGLFHSVDSGDSWRRIYKGRNDLQDNCTALLVCGEGIFLGTGQGLYISRDLGRTWQKESGKLADSPILAFASIRDEAGHDQVYAAAVEGVFRMRSEDKTWERVFVSVASEEAAGVCDDADDPETAAERTSNIRYLAASQGSDPCLYLATSRGVYISVDRAKTWKALPDYGLLSRDVKFILVTGSGEIFAATSSGIFKYTGLRWQELSFTLAAQDTRFLAGDGNGDLYAACDQGLFRAQRRDFASYKADEKRPSYSGQEPGIEEVQKAAVKYAEVCPEKIKLWRRQAAASALLPTISATVNRDTGDLWHWESGSSTKEGDDILTKGSDSLGWDVRLSWDLGQFIWNPDQTSIDVRSRLMVELRNDILDQVNKIYFERLRVRMELEDLGVEDKKKRVEKELRFRELTASLDGLTGGYFSRKTKRG